MGVVEKEKRTTLAFPNEPSRRGAILPEGTADVMDGNRRRRRMGCEDDGVKKQIERLRGAESSALDYGHAAWACMRYVRVLPSWGTFSKVLRSWGSQVCCISPDSRSVDGTCIENPNRYVHSTLGG